MIHLDEYGGIQLGPEKLFREKIKFSSNYCDCFLIEKCMFDHFCTLNICNQFQSMILSLLTTVYLFNTKTMLKVRKKITFRWMVSHSTTKL
jgi:hypothetical protein